MPTQRGLAIRALAASEFADFRKVAHKETTNRRDGNVDR